MKSAEQLWKDWGLRFLEMGFAQELSAADVRQASMEMLRDVQTDALESAAVIAENTGDPYLLRDSKIANAIRALKPVKG